MKIEHIAMYVDDLERAKGFFESYFGGIPGNIYHNSQTGFSSYFLRFTDGARLELMHRPDVRKAHNSCNNMGYAHIAFSLGSKDNVDELTKRLEYDGYTVISGSRTTGDGYYESCILDSEGNTIELTV